jgi:hypothetical protein
MWGRYEATAVTSKLEGLFIGDLSLCEYRDWNTTPEVQAYVDARTAWRALVGPPT